MRTSKSNDSSDHNALLPVLMLPSLLPHNVTSKGWDTETPFLSEWALHRYLLAHIPSHTCFNTRRRHLMYAFNLVRKAVLRVLDVAVNHQCCIGSLPVPVVQSHLVPGAFKEWAINGANLAGVEVDVGAEAHVG
jgi:hypothetical protein